MWLRWAGIFVFYAIMTMCSIFWTLRPPHVTISNALLVFLVQYTLSTVWRALSTLMFGGVHMAFTHPLHIPETSAKLQKGFVETRALIPILFGHAFGLLAWWIKFEGMNVQLEDTQTMLTLALLGTVHTALCSLMLSGPGNDGSNTKKEGSIRTALPLFGTLTWYFSDGKYLLCPLGMRTASYPAQSLVFYYSGVVLFASLIVASIIRPGILIIHTGRSSRQ